MPIFLLIALSLILFPTQNSLAVEKKTINLSIIDWCPAICPDKKDKGYILEQVNSIYKAAGYSVNFKNYSWTRAIKEVKTGKLDALLSPVKEEAPNLIYPNRELGFQETCFFVRNTDNWMFNGIKSLKQKRVIAMIENNSLINYDNFAKKNPQIFHYVPFNDYINKVLKMMNYGRINTFVFTKTETNYHLNKIKKASKFKNAGCVSKAKLYIAFNPKNRYRSKKLSDTFDEGMEKLKKSGERESILKKYFVE